MSISGGPDGGSTPAGRGARWLSWIFGAAILAVVVAAALHFSEGRQFLVPLGAVYELSLAKLLGAAASPRAVFASFMISSLLRTVGIVPGGLGTFEAASVWTLRSMGVAVPVALASTLLLRALSFWLPMVPGLWISRRITAGAATARPEPGIAAYWRRTGRRTAGRGEHT
jgi:hypothetical protein